MSSGQQILKNKGNEADCAHLLHVHKKCHRIYRQKKDTAFFYTHLPAYEDETECSETSDSTHTYLPMNMEQTECSERSDSTRTYLPMKMEQTDCSEMSDSTRTYLSMKMEQTECSETSDSTRTYLPMKMEQSAPKRLILHPPTCL